LNITAAARAKEKYAQLGVRQLVIADQAVDCFVQRSVAAQYGDFAVTLVEGVAGELGGMGLRPVVKATGAAVPNHL